MKIELLIICITIFFVANTYYDGKYMEKIKSWKKYYQMGMYGFIGLSLYLFIRKNPEQGKSLLKNANGIIRHLPIDKDAGDLLSPIFKMTDTSLFSPQVCQQAGGVGPTPQQKRMMNSGFGTKRSVSETKKKFVAAQQNWCCKNCNEQLPGAFEVDHKIRLEHGGSNHIDNLVALCRNCHGEKTALETM